MSSDKVVHKHQWGVDLAYPSHQWPEKDYLIRSVAGLESGSAGMGFGFRDHQYDGLTKSEAEELAVRIRKGVPDLEYCNAYEDTYGCPHPKCREEWDETYEGWK